MRISVRQARNVALDLGEGERMDGVQPCHLTRSCHHDRRKPWHGEKLLAAPDLHGPEFVLVGTHPERVSVAVSGIATNNADLESRAVSGGIQLILPQPKRRIHLLDQTEKSRLKQVHRRNKFDDLACVPERVGVFRFEGSVVCDSNARGRLRVLIGSVTVTPPRPRAEVTAFLRSEAVTPPSDRGGPSPPFWPASRRWPSRRRFRAGPRWPRRRVRHS